MIFKPFITIFLVFVVLVILKNVEVLSFTPLVNYADDIVRTLETKDQRPRFDDYGLARYLNYRIRKTLQKRLIPKDYYDDYYDDYDDYYDDYDDYYDDYDDVCVDCDPFMLYLKLDKLINCCNSPIRNSAASTSSPCNPATTTPSPCNPATTTASPCNPATLTPSLCNPATTTALPCNPATTKSSPCNPATSTPSPCNPATTTSAPSSTPVSSTTTTTATTQIITSTVKKSTTTPDSKPIQDTSCITTDGGPDQCFRDDKEGENLPCKNWKTCKQFTASNKSCILWTYALDPAFHVFNHNTCQNPSRIEGGDADGPWCFYDNKTRDDWELCYRKCDFEIATNIKSQLKEPKIEICYGSVVEIPENAGPMFTSTFQQIDGANPLSLSELQTLPAINGTPLVVTNSSVTQTTTTQLPMNVTNPGYVSDSSLSQTNTTTATTTQTPINVTNPDLVSDFASQRINASLPVNIKQAGAVYTSLASEMRPSEQLNAQAHGNAPRVGPVPVTSAINSTEIGSGSTNESTVFAITFPEPLSAATTQVHAMKPTSKLTPNYFKLPID